MNNNTKTNMKVEDIKSVDDVSNYIEGCLNDFNEGISTLDETNKYLHELTVRVIEIAQASLQPISEEEIEKAAWESARECTDDEFKQADIVQDFTTGANYVLSRGVAKESVPSDEECEHDWKGNGIRPDQRICSKCDKLEYQ